MTDFSVQEQVGMMEVRNKMCRIPVSFSLVSKMRVQITNITCAVLFQAQFCVYVMVMNEAPGVALSESPGG